MQDNQIIQHKKEKVYIFGKTRVVVEIPKMTVAQKRECLIRLYDTVNSIAENCEKRGIDTSGWFYTFEDIEKMKTDSKYIFI